MKATVVTKLCQFNERIVFCVSLINTLVEAVVCGCIFIECDKAYNWSVSLGDLWEGKFLFEQTLDVEMSTKKPKN